MDIRIRDGKGRIAALPPLTGRRFDRLLVREEVIERRTKSHRYYRCECDCGGVSVVAQAHLRSGHTTSCGCRMIETSGLVNRRHGRASYKRGIATEYRIWQNMLTRCGNPKATNYKDYGGRGITVCRQWAESFIAFLRDVGSRPSMAYSLDRINNDGNYEPGNVRWATQIQQQNNKRPRRRKSHSQAAS